MHKTKEKKSKISLIKQNSGKDKSQWNLCWLFSKEKNIKVKIKCISSIDGLKQCFI